MRNIAKPILVVDNSQTAGTASASPSRENQATPIARGPATETAPNQPGAALPTAPPVSISRVPSLARTGPSTDDRAAVSGPSLRVSQQLNQTRPTGRHTGKKKVIAVVGAASAPGRGLIRAVLEDKKSPFAVRAITQHLDSDESRFLDTLGTEVVAGHVSDEGSLRRAFTGAHAAFYVLNSSEHHFLDTKLAEATAIARAAKDAGLQHVIWATLEDPGQALLKQDDLTPTFKDGRWVGGDGHLTETGKAFTQLAVPTTFLRTSWDPTVAPGKWTEEIGTTAYGILRSGDAVGGTVSIDAGQLASGLAQRSQSESPSPPPPRRGRARLIGVAIAALSLTGLAIVMHSRRHKADMMPTAIEVPPRRAAVQPRQPTMEGPGDRGPAPTPSSVDPGGEARSPTSGTKTPSVVGAVVGPVVRSPVKRGLQKSPRHGEEAGLASKPPASHDPEGPSVRSPESLVNPETRPEREPPANLPASAPEQHLPISSETAFQPPPLAAAKPPALAEPKPPGFVEPKAVAATVRAHAAEAQACFDRAVMDRSDLHGRLTVRATVDATGRVVSASAASTIDGGARLQSCLVSAFESWRFPPPTGGVNGGITYSFAFKSETAD